MRRLFVALTSAVSVLTLAHMASAADLDARVVYKAPPPVPPPIRMWSGIYSGWEGGYGWGQQGINGLVSRGDPLPTSSPTSFFPDVVLPSGDINQSGWLYGGFVGAQEQWGNWVLGLEADYDGANIKGSSATSSAVSSFDTLSFTNITIICVPQGTNCLSVNHSVSFDAKIDGLGSLRGKVGWSFWQNWLFYGTGGLAFAHEKGTLTSTESTNFEISGATANGFISNSATGGGSMLGWAAGAGIDYKWQIDPCSAVIFGVEYLHYQFDTNTLTLPDQFGTGFAAALNTKESVDTIKGRISYLFSISSLAPRR